MRKLTHEEISGKRYTLEQLRTAERLPFYALIDNIRSLYNVGSIFRTADGARVEKLYLCGFTPHPPRKEIEKTALGATKSVPWEYHEDPLFVIAQLKSRNVHICVLEQTNESIPYTEIRVEKLPICLIVGNEITGVSKEIVATADSSVDIPMYGLKQSLNAAVAFGIAAFEIVRKIKKKKY